MDVVIYLGKALICFANLCHPALIGDDTRVGQYTMAVLETSQPGYGGDVLMYDGNEEEWYAVHRTYTRDRRRDRSVLYDGTTPAQRRVTAGCVNVEPEIYDQLRRDYSTSRLVILP